MGFTTFIMENDWGSSRLYENRSSSQTFALALQTARIIVQFTTYHNESSSDESLARYIQRDAFMAENVAWIHDHAAGSHPKLIVWAHDVHIANDTSYYAGFAPDGTDNMGGFLRTWYKQNYLPIATSLYQGTFNAYQQDYRVITETIGMQANDTYNSMLGNAGIPIYMLDLRTTPPGPVTIWANGPHGFLLIGLDGGAKTFPVSLKHWFDVI
jgi:erythromycin esterase